MTTFVDFALDKEKGYYDISVGDNFDFAKTEGLDTYILVALLTDARASASEQPNSLYRRGWWGDNFNVTSLGSKLWIYTSAPLTNETRNGVIDAAKNALNVAITDGFADTVNVDAVVNLQSGGLTLIIKLIKNGNVTERQFEILENT